MRMLLGGDVMLGRLMSDWLLREGRSPFTAVQPWLERADLVGVNLECAITARETWYEGPPKAFMFKALPAAARILKEAGIRVVSLANNHALDAGEPGLADTLRLLDEQGIAHAGAGMTLEEASRPALLDSPAGRVAVLAYCNHQPDFAATPRKPGIRYLALDDPDVALAEIRQDLGRVRQSADWIVLSFHWQPNWAPSVTAEIRHLAHGCIREGAHVIWGHSPHHFQGVELFEHGGIVYSAGDFVDDYAVDPGFRNDRQLLFTVTLAEQALWEIEALPVEILHGSVMPAEQKARDWIAQRFVRACGELGVQPAANAELWIVRR